MYVSEFWVGGGSWHIYILLTVHPLSTFGRPMSAHGEFSFFVLYIAWSVGHTVKSNMSANAKLLTDFRQVHVDGNYVM